MLIEFLKTKESHREAKRGGLSCFFFGAQCLILGALQFATN
jgi:hypothetical protein